METPGSMPGCVLTAVPELISASANKNLVQRSGGSDTECGAEW